MVGRKKAATDAICGGFTPPLLQTTRGAVMQSTDIDALLRDLDESRLHAQSAHLFGSAELYFRATTALAAERDRADRAEARIERCAAALDAEHTRANLAEAQLRGGTNDTYIIELPEATA